MINKNNMKRDLSLIIGIFWFLGLGIYTIFTEPMFNFEKPLLSLLTWVAVVADFTLSILGTITLYRLNKKR